MRVMRTPALVGVVSFLAFGCQPAAAPSSHPAPRAPWSASEMDAVKLRAMQALDEEPADLDGPAIAMETELAGLAERALAADDAGLLTTPEDRESAGLALVYDGMVVLHDAHLVDLGKIHGARLYATRRYDAAGGPLTDPAAVRAESAARRRKVGDLMTRAQRLRPSDGRIPSWIAAASAHEHARPTGELADGDQGKLLAAVDVDTLFNLFTALIVMRHEPTDAPRGAALFEKTQAFLKADMCKNIVPGSKQARFCNDSPLAPWNEEAATVILSDEYLRRGEDALRRGDVPTAMPALGMAKGLLGVLDDDAHREATSRWKHRALVDVRRKRLAALAPGQPLPDASFWRSEAYERMYACATCHVK
jgi:hypothetical protein